MHYLQSDVADILYATSEAQLIFGADDSTEDNRIIATGQFDSLDHNVLSAGQYDTLNHNDLHVVPSRKVVRKSIGSLLFIGLY